MTRIRLFICTAALAITLLPLPASAQDLSPQHLEDELDNGFAQLDLAEEQVAEMQDEGNRSAQNERMIALLRSEAARDRQLSLISNANAMEDIAMALSDSLRAQGDINARNSLMIAQGQAATILANVDANLANGRMLAINKGRLDELANAEAQSNLLHQVADFITGELAAINMSNERLIAQQRADEVGGPAIAEVENATAMAANELLGADLELRAGALAATSTSLTMNGHAADVVAHAQASLRNAKAMAGVTD
jgi:hypothetical protein